MSGLLSGLAILALLARPECGNIPSDSDPAQHLVATALRESGGDPLIIGINAEPSRGLPAGQFRARSVSEAVAAVHTLWAQRRRLDLGLFGISDANLGRHHLTPETAFDECLNAAAGAEHLADDFRAATWNLAHRRFNCGGFDCGVAYAAGVTSNAATGYQIPTRGPPPPPEKPPCAPEWDAWAQASCNSSQGKKP